MSCNYQYFYCQYPVLAPKCVSNWNFYQSLVGELGKRCRWHSFRLDGTKPIIKKTIQEGLRIPRALSFLLVAGVADEAAVGAEGVGAGEEAKASPLAGQYKRNRFISFLPQRPAHPAGLFLFICHLQTIKRDN